MMIPVEKLIDLFKRSNRPIAYLHLFNFFYNLIGLIAIYATIAMLDQGVYPSNISPSASEMRELLSTLPATYGFNTLVNMAFNLVIMISTFANLSRLKKGKRLSDIPYLLGITLSTINVITELINGLSAFNTFMQFIYLSFYLSARNTARLLNVVHDKFNQK